MGRFKVKEKLKKSLIVTIVTVMMVFMMPVKSNADILNDFIDLLLRIPDGVMHIIDKYIGGSEEFTLEQLEFRGGWDEGGRLYNFIVTPYDIFSSGTYEENSGSYYTKLGLLDINFFADRPITSETIVSSEILAPVVGNVYKGLRNLCMVLMLLVVLYIGIKILISSIAAQQAKYKQMLVDWLVGFALLFAMHYIMSGIVYLNSVVVKMLSNDEGDSYYVGIAELEDNGDGSDSTWFDYAENTVNNAWDKPKYFNFKTKRLAVRNSTDEKETFSNYIDSNGKIDLNSVPRGKQGATSVWVPFAGSTKAMTINAGYIGISPVEAKKWGKDGTIYLSAKIINPGHDNEKFENKAIVRLNAMSYVRTISSFGSEDNDSVILYDNGGTTQVDKDWVVVMGFSILYLCLVIETIMFTFTYIKRVLQMSFLTMIAPVVAIMYPVDKIGDGKAQAFNTWFKDYLFNILIQPMHLLLYTVFFVAASELVSRNIIYALAVYGFMIPSEKYFKKILGFEKASTGGGGPLGGAIGRGLAMDGLGKLAGIGPGGKGKGGSGDGGRKKLKTKKNNPSDVGTRGRNPMSGGGDSESSAPLGAGTQSGKQQRMNQKNGSKKRPGAGGIGSTLRSIKPLNRLGNTIDRRIARAVTGGEYSHLNGRNGSARAAARYLSRGAGRMVTRGFGAALGGAVGLTAGAATAMATGDINNLWKGTAVGVGAGNKLSSNLYDRGADFIEGFHDDMKQELANEDSDRGRELNRKLRTEEAYKKLDEDLMDIPESERADYEKAIDNMAEFVNIDSIKDVKGLVSLRKDYKNLYGTEITNEEAQKIYDEELKGIDVATHRDAYIEERLSQDGITKDKKLELDKNYSKIMAARADPRDADHAKYSTPEYDNLINKYDAANSRADMIKGIQGKMK